MVSHPPPPPLPAPAPSLSFLVIRDRLHFKTGANLRLGPGNDRMESFRFVCHDEQ